MYDAYCKCSDFCWHLDIYCIIKPWAWCISSLHDKSDISICKHIWLSLQVDCPVNIGHRYSYVISQQHTVQFPFLIPSWLQTSDCFHIWGCMTPITAHIGLALGLLYCFQIPRQKSFGERHPLLISLLAWVMETGVQKHSKHSITVRDSILHQPKNIFLNLPTSHSDLPSSQSIQSASRAILDFAGRSLWKWFLWGFSNGIFMLLEDCGTCGWRAFIPSGGNRFMLHCFLNAFFWQPNTSHVVNWSAKYDAESSQGIEHVTYFYNFSPFFSFCRKCTALT